MSRYVDLNGLTWDGTPITSKIQEVKTKSGYLQGITTGWLWGDNVPHIDLADHDKQIRDEVVVETLESVIKMIADWGYEDLSTVVLRENLKARIEQMKEE